MSVSCAVSEISNSGVTLLQIWVSRLGVVQGRWKWRHSIDHIRFTISLPL